MDYDRLWAPWRLAYVTGSEESEEGEKQSPPEPTRWLPGSDRDCFLCRFASEYDESADRATADRANLVVRRGAASVVVLNRYPYNNGHLLVAPRNHKSSLGDLSIEEQGEIHRWLVVATALLGKRMNAEGFNVGLNLGRAAGAGLPGHLHWHIVPRWQGDTNFMPSLAGARVIPQALDALWEFLYEEMPESV